MAPAPRKEGDSVVPGLKLKCRTMLTDLDGGAIKMKEDEVDLGRAIALILIGGTDSSDPLRSYLFARALMDKKELELNQVDLKFLKEAVAASKFFTALVIGQILAHLQN